jgi:DNA-directed RNA polymerase subunit RPC12/RpoP
MQTNHGTVTDTNGQRVQDSQALWWGNNASWICVKCGRLLGNRTGDTEYLVQCPQCETKYEILRGLTKKGNRHLAPALGVKLC